MDSVAPFLPIGPVSIEVRPSRGLPFGVIPLISANKLRIPKALRASSYSLCFFGFCDLLSKLDAVIDYFEIVLAEGRKRVLRKVGSLEILFTPLVAPYFEHYACHQLP